jgi:hypothetical protein
MKSINLYVVRYNDCYGNGDEKLEVIVESHKDFLKWLEVHNQERSDLQDLDIDDDDFCYETEEQFDLIPLDLITFDL